jgi:hypothetical protein
MLPAIRTLDSVRLSWHLLAETVAPTAQPTTHTRVGKDRRTGEPRVWQVVRRPKKIVSNGGKVTGELFLSLARKGAQRLASSPTLWSQVVMTDAGVPELPPLYTNGVELARKRGVTDRTIRTHIQELKKAGLITRSKYRGTNASYCLWINPDFVWETAPAASKSEKTSASENAFLSPSGKNLPLIEVLETTRTLKSEISNGEKLVTHREGNEASKTGNPSTGNAGPQRGSEPGAQASKSGAGGAGAARAERFLEKATAHGTGAKKAEAKRLVEWFWSYAKALIYNKQTFTAEAERQAKNAIWEGVFHGFHTGGPADWLAWLPGLQRRIELAAAWFARNPTCWPATPYAEVLPGRGYFDAGNEKGFARTLGWWLTEKTKREQGALERALDEALAELHQRRRLDAGQRRVQASKRAKQKDALELHRFHFTKLRRLGGDDALVRFAARLQAEHLLAFPTCLIPSTH